jgi:hypothetical protein
VLNTFDDSADSLIREFTSNATQIKAKLGEKDYTEILKLLEDLKKDETEKGKFVSKQGDIDRRDADKKDI